MSQPRCDNRILLYAAIIVLLILLIAWANRGTAAPMRRPPPEPVVQVKLRDLLDAIPRKEAAEIASRLRSIEERLTAIEGKLPPVVPAPAVAPLGKPR